MSNINSNPLEWKANAIENDLAELRENFKVSRDIVRFLRDDCTARQNQSALLMYLEKRLSNMQTNFDRLSRTAEYIRSYSPNDPEDLPF